VVAQYDLRRHCLPRLLHLLQGSPARAVSPAPQPALA
jgi:hypothetical protein